MSSYLTPPPTQRPVPKRLLSLQTPPRPHPYATPSPSSENYPLSPLSPFPVGFTGFPKRPGAPRRAHSFYGDSANTTFALACTGQAGHLSNDKTQIVAPPLQRTLSSMGSKGNCSPVSQQMARPRSRATSLLDGESRPPLREISIPQARAGLPTPPSSPIPTIIIHNSTPPRPSLNTLASSASRGGATSEPASSTMSSRSASDTTIGTPSTPLVNAVFGSRIDENDYEDDEEISVTDAEDVTPRTKRIDMAFRHHHDDDDEIMDLDDVAHRVRDLIV